MGRIGLPEVLLIVLVAVLLFGTKKLPGIGRAFGKALREFRKADQDLERDAKDGGDQESSGS